ncbi:MAG TPA: NADP-dependent oxidoreductase [Actinomycetes bacterium]|nr:NADP-dependent oxidoreductase [Actinomycetes bacterium]
MRALHVPAAGEPPQLSDLPKPEPTEGTVLIKVKAAGLNPFDNSVASGMLSQMVPHEYPVVLGRDAAGVVEAVGPGVEHVAVGDEVIGHVLFAPPIHAGTLAEYAVVPAEAVFAKPADLDFVTAAALPVAGAAAVAAVEAIDPQPGQTVLINGASGGVGSFAIQLVAARGATVVATGTATDTDRLTDLGATTVVDFTAGPVARQVLDVHPDGVDALIDLVNYSPDGLPLDAVRKGGTVASTMNAADEAALNAAGLTGTNLMANPIQDVLAPLANQAADGTLRVEVATVLPLDQATDGLATLASGHAEGKIVITVTD